MGPMWSGKTNRLISAVDAARLDYDKVVVVKHVIDKRSGNVTARTGLSLPAQKVVDSLDELRVPSGKTLYAVDEAQFFGDNLMRFWERLEFTEHSLIVSGLDLDYRREPFGQVIALARRAMDVSDAVAVERLTARCDHRDSKTGRLCKRRATYTQRLSAGGENTVLVGGSEYYAPSCPAHHKPHPVSELDWGRPAHGAASPGHAHDHHNAGPSNNGNDNG